MSVIELSFSNFKSSGGAGNAIGRFEVLIVKRKLNNAHGRREVMRFGSLESFHPLFL